MTRLGPVKRATSSSRSAELGSLDVSLNNESSCCGQKQRLSYTATILVFVLRVATTVGFDSSEEASVNTFEIR